MRQTTLDLRAAIPAVSCWLAAVVLIGIPGVAGWWGLGLWFATAASLLLAAVTRAPASRVRVVAALSAVGFAGAAIAATVIAVNAPARAPSALHTLSGHAVTVVARVDSPPVPGRTKPGFGTGDRVMVDATASAVRAGTREVSGAIPLLVFLPGKHGVEIGQLVEVRGTLRMTAPGDDRAALLYASGPQGLLERAPPWLGWADGMRDGFAKAATDLPGDGGTLLPGLAIGDVSAVPADLDLAMKASSLSHLTAVSGANCAVVIAIVMAAGSALGLRRSIRVTTALVALLGFVLLVTPGPSVLRAAVMAAIVVFSYAAGRPGRGLPALAAAVLSLLVANPWFARDYGFTLSVLATGGLLILAAPLAAAFGRIMPRPLALAIAVPVSAQLACQPVLILLNPAVPLYGVAANLLAEPAAALATIVGLVACVLIPWLPGLGVAVAQLAWLPSAWIAAVARVCAGLPSSQLPWPDGLFGVALIVLMSAAALAAVFRRGRFRVVALCVVGLFLSGYLGGVLGGEAVRRLAVPQDWQLGACDIGQGDAILLRDGDRYGMIDVGPEPEALTECLEKLGISRIDLLVLTHYDLDHVGGVEAVIGKVGTALVGPAETAKDRRVVAGLEAGGAAVRQAIAGDSGRLGDLDWRVLWPKSGSRVMQTGNEGSITLEVEGKGVRSIFLGDLDERAQDALLATRAVRSVDVVKVAHHGSADQSERLYRAVGARLGLISVGADNDYGHPTARLLGILARTGTAVARTDLEGMLLVSATPDGALRLWTEKQSAQPIGGRGGVGDAG